MKAAEKAWYEFTADEEPGSDGHGTSFNREIEPDQAAEHLEALLQTIKGEFPNHEEWWKSVKGISLEITRDHDLTIIRYG